MPELSPAMLGGAAVRQVVQKRRLAAVSVVAAGAVTRAGRREKCRSRERDAFTAPEAVNRTRSFERDAFTEIER
jgi:hypothetical protein